MKNVLVTGGTGLLGNNIIRSLIDQGIQARAAIRTSSSQAPLDGLPVEVARIDFENEESIESALQGIDTVVHSAGFIWFGWTKLEQSRRVNVDITRRIATVCMRKGIRFVHVSSLDALPVSYQRKVVDETALNEPDKWDQKVACNYVVSKREADDALDELFKKGLSGCIVHPSLMLGPYDWKPSTGELIQAISKMGWMFSCPTGGISVTDVRDVARATIRAGQVGQTARRYILAGHNIPYRELCERIAKKCNVSRPLGRTGPMAYAVAWMVGGITSLFGKETIVNTASIQMARLWHYYSSDRAIEELGYEIRDLDQIIDDAIDWLAKQHMIQDRRKSSN